MEYELAIQSSLDLDRGGREIVNQEIDRGLHEIAEEFERRVRMLTPVGVGGGSGSRAPSPARCAACRPVRR